MRKQSRRGSALVEFAFAGIPILLTIIAVMEFSRCMWTYNTLTYAVTEATRMAAVHGADCATPPNACSIHVADIAQRIADSSPGLQTDQITNVQFSAGGGAPITCPSLSSCLTNGSVWPAFPQGTVILITAVYPFQSPMAMFFPGFASSTPWITANLQASSQETIQF
jgi:hypothetical protein